MKRNPVHGLLITPNGVVQEGTFPGFKSIQETVGGYLEALTLPNNVTGWIDEDGKAKGLKVNLLGSCILNQLGYEFLPGDFIVGNLVLIGSKMENGELVETDLPKDARERIIAQVKFIVAMLENNKRKQQ